MRPPWEIKATTELRAQIVRNNLWEAVQLNLLIDSRMWSTLTLE